MNQSDISTFVVGTESVELLGDDALTLEQLAQACCSTAQWLTNRVQAGVLMPAVSGDRIAVHQWRFSAATVVRARRLADLERAFDADPQLAALTVDLMEEVALLRRRLHMLAGD